MKPPLRELVMGGDLDGPSLPAEDLAFLRLLGGPSLVRLTGRDNSRLRVVSTLLHGNEPSGLRACLRFLRAGDVPATDVLFFFGSPATALAEPPLSIRALPGEPDANRCWLGPWEKPAGQVAKSVLERLRAERPECLVDLHNNSGHNPPYGVAFRLGPAELSLIAMFSNRVVHTPIRLGTLVEATVSLFPSVTIECGRAGDPIADETAWQGLHRFLLAEEIHAPFSTPLYLLDSPVRVRVREGVDVAFANTPDPDVPLTIRNQLDLHNFERLAVGSEIGWVRSGERWPFEASSSDGVERSRTLLEARSRVLYTRKEFVPVMMTTDREIAMSDCLFYAVQPVGWIHT